MSSIELIQGTAEHLCKVLGGDDLKTAKKIRKLLVSLDSDYELTVASMLFLIASHVDMPEENRQGFFAACGVALEMIFQLIQEGEHGSTQH